MKRYRDEFILHTNVQADLTKITDVVLNKLFYSLGLGIIAEV